MASEGTVAVGLGGGMSSAVSAALLNSQGYDVVGVYLRMAKPPLRDGSSSKPIAGSLILRINFGTFVKSSVFVFTKSMSVNTLWPKWAITSFTR
jgi:adenylyl- and sulfurtransferase ThiI